MPFYVPYHPEYNQGALADAGLVGKYVTQRGLTFYTVQLAGHGKHILGKHGARAECVIRNARLHSRRRLQSSREAAWPHPLAQHRKGTANLA